MPEHRFLNFNADGATYLYGVYVGDHHRYPEMHNKSEAELLENQEFYKYTGPQPIAGGPGSQDSGADFARDPWVPHDPDPDWHPEPHGTVGSPQFGQPGFYDIDDWYSQAAEARPDYYNPFLNPGLPTTAEALEGPPFAGGDATAVVDAIFQPIVDTFPEWESRGESDMPEYGSYRQDPSMCKLALMNKGLIAIVQAGAVTSTGNPLLGVVGSILENGLRRLNVGPDWGRRIFGDGPDVDLCQRIVEEAIQVGYLRIPKPNEDGSLPGRMQITLDPDSPRATLQWRRKAAATRRAPARRAPARRTYRRRRT